MKNLSIKSWHNVEYLAKELEVWECFVRGVDSRIVGEEGRILVSRLGTLPVRPSHAVGLLGSYLHRGPEPLAIRLQPYQETTQLGITLLHELAHACDHLTAVDPGRHRCTHGPNWRLWARTFAIDPVVVGHSPALSELRRSRLKPVAVCERCGTVFHRLRRLAARRRWTHPQCGNGRIVPLPVSTGRWI